EIFANDRVRLHRHAVVLDRDIQQLFKIIGQLMAVAGDNIEREIMRGAKGIGPGIGDIANARGLEYLGQGLLNQILNVLVLVQKPGGIAFKLALNRGQIDSRHKFHVRYSLLSLFSRNPAAESSINPSKRNGVLGGKPPSAEDLHGHRERTPDSPYKNSICKSVQHFWPHPAPQRAANPATGNAAQPKSAYSFAS